MLMRIFVSISIVLLALACMPVCAQRNKREPLTPAEIDKIREAGIYPEVRIKLYTEFVAEHVETIRGLAARRASAARAHRLESELLDLAALMDELGSNLDVYQERKADIRKSLGALHEATPKWLETLRALATEPAFELSLKESIESAQDLADQATQLLMEQTAYFEAHKDERGQERYEPR